MESNIDVTPTAVEPQNPSEVLNDPDYFFENGDCVFRAEDCMFKLHKLILSRDSESMFPDMFGVPQGEVSSDPMDLILLVGDSAADFRALCWALYALPPEIQAQNEAGADIGRLVAVANLSHKYLLSSFESWAVGMMWVHCQPGCDYLARCTQDMLDAIHDAAVAGERQDLSSLVEEKWLARLKSGELELRHALDFGEARGMMEFLGRAYYQQALQMQQLAPTTGAEAQATDFSQFNLNHLQIYRLLAGYCSLSLMCEKFRKKDLPDPCLYDAWDEEHEESFSKLRAPEAEPLSFLKKLEASAMKNENCPCRRLLLERIRSQDHFQLTKGF
ncbi:hypothetical protein C8R46DRAFT_1223628 [Mycena filopes]|nr:hypothetical protein C8R46DRAFT_1223628 [Mycena filopes]